MPPMPPVTQPSNTGLPVRATLRPSSGGRERRARGTNSLSTPSMASGLLQKRGGAFHKTHTFGFERKPVQGDRGTGVTAHTGEIRAPLRPVSPPVKGLVPGEKQYAAYSAGAKKRNGRIRSASPGSRQAKQGDLKSKAQLGGRLLRGISPNRPTWNF